MSRAKTVQAKHLSDEAVLAAIRSASNDGRWPGQKRRWVSRGDVEAAFPDVPWKVVLAKLRSLLKRNVIDGCGCGCRGDFHIIGEWP